MIRVLNSDIILGIIDKRYYEIMHSKQVTFMNEKKWILLKGDGMVTE